MKKEKDLIFHLRWWTFMAFLNFLLIYIKILNKSEYFKKISALSYLLSCCVWSWSNGGIDVDEKSIFITYNIIFFMKSWQQTSSETLSPIIGVASERISQSMYAFCFFLQSKVMASMVRVPIQSRHSWKYLSLDPNEIHVEPNYINSNNQAKPNCKIFSPP